MGLFHINEENKDKIIYRDDAHILTSSTLFILNKLVRKIPVIDIQKVTIIGHGSIMITLEEEEINLRVRPVSITEEHSLISRTSYFATMLSLSVFMFGNPPDYVLDFPHRKGWCRYCSKFVDIPEEYALVKNIWEIPCPQCGKKGLTSNILEDEIKPKSDRRMVR